MSENHCGECYYMGWTQNIIIKWCFHPKNNREIKKWGLCCPEFFAADNKQEPIKVERVDKWMK